MEPEHLALKNQLCFPFYVASRLIIRAYQPLLDELGITYPQYLVLLVLWETNNVTVNDIVEKLFLNTNTVTPLLKRMEEQGLLTRQRSQSDERRVLVALTERGKALKAEADSIPEKLMASLHSEDMSVEDLTMMLSQINKMIEHLAQTP